MAALLFLHGYGRPPRDYRRMLELLEARGHTVEAPFLYGNHSLAEPPTSVRQAYEMSRAWRERVDWRETIVVGHSTGAGMALLLALENAPPRGVIALCPIRKVDYSWTGFLWRSLQINAKHWLMLSGSPWAGVRLELETSLGFHVNMLRKPGAMARFVGDLVHFDLAQAARTWPSLEAPASCPVAHLHTSGDEFFDVSPGYEAEVRSLFPRLEWQVLERPSHEWCLVQPAQAAQWIQERIEGWQAADAPGDPQAVPE